MKKKYLLKLTALIISITISFSLKSQVVYEHTYTGQATLVKLANSGYKYYTVDKDNKKLKLYNTDHSQWKNIDLAVPAGFDLSGIVYGVSEMLFTLDGKVGFSYSYFKTSPVTYYETRVITEDGSILQTINDAVYAFAYSSGENEAKLLAYCTDYTTNETETKIYSLPGSIISAVMQNEFNIGNAYPNPAKNYITIPYPAKKLDPDGEVRVYTVNGGLLKTYKIDQTFDHLQIETASFPCGNYIYNIYCGDRHLGSGKFIIHQKL